MTDFYVKPEVNSGTPAGSGTKVDPWNGLANIGWGPSVNGGDTVYLLNGTYQNETIEVGKTYTAASPVTIKAVTRRRAVLDGGSTITQGILTNAKEGVHVEGLEIREYTGLGISMLAQTVRGPDGCHVKDCYVHDCDAGGISIGFPASFTDISATTYDDIEIMGNLVEDVGGRGISVLGTIRGATVSHNTINRAVQGTVNAWGLYAAGDHLNDDAAGLPSWVNTTGNTWRMSLGATSYSAKTAVGVQFNGRTPGTGPYVLTDGGAGTAPGTDEFTQDSADIYIDANTDDPNSFSVVFIFSTATGVVFDNNLVTDTGDNAGALDGVGMGFDHGVESSTLKNSISHSNPGPGISFNTAVSCTATGNYSYNNDEGISLTNITGTTVLRQNATQNNTTVGYDFERLDSTSTIDFRNNSGRETLFTRETNVSGTLTEDYNYGLAAAGANSISATPPIFSVDGRTQPDSVGYAAALFIAGFHDTDDDHDTIVYRAAPDIGRQGNIVATGRARILSSTDPAFRVLNLIGYAPTAMVSGKILPGVGALNITGAIPTLSFNFRQAPSAGVLQIQGYEPVAMVSGKILPGVGALNITGAIPTLSFTFRQSPGAGVLQIQGYEPTVSTGKTITASPSAGVLQITGAIPTLSRGIRKSPGAGVLKITGAIPDVSVTTKALTASPLAGTLQISGHTPSVTGGKSVVVPPTGETGAGEGSGGGVVEYGRRRDLRDSPSPVRTSQGPQLDETPPESTPAPVTETETATDVEARVLADTAALREDLAEDAKTLAKMEDLLGANEMALSALEKNKANALLLLLLID